MMSGMGNMGSEMMNLGINGIQNTNKQEYNQRQALFQNIMRAMDDSAWLMQHFPNFYGWNSQGGGGGGYEAASNAPQAYAGKHYDPNVQGLGGNSGGLRTADTASLGNVVVAPNDYYKSPGASSMGMGGGISGGYSSLWS